MNQLEKVPDQTPIEIALQVDEKGMTTARKLYEFLELSKGQFSRWCKTNILENSFAVDNEDYIGFDINVEGNITTDYKLTSDFAKKLAMVSKSPRGEEARDYFIKVEDKLKDFAKNDYSNLSPELQMFKSIFDQVAKQEIENKKLQQDVQAVNERVDDIREVIALDTTSWREDTRRLLSKMADTLGGGQAFSQVRAESYGYLEKRMGVSLQTRSTNKRRRMAEEGICKSKRDKLSYVDIIAEDKKLIEGYTAIVKEMAIKYGVA